MVAKAVGDLGAAANLEARHVRRTHARRDGGPEHQAKRQERRQHRGGGGVENEECEVNRQCLSIEDFLTKVEYPYNCQRSLPHDSLRVTGPDVDANTHGGCACSHHIRMHISGSVNGDPRTDAHA